MTLPNTHVTAELDPAIHTVTSPLAEGPEEWVPGSSPGMTEEGAGGCTHSLSREKNSDRREASANWRERNKTAGCFTHSLPREKNSDRREASATARRALRAPAEARTQSVRNSRERNKTVAIPGEEYKNKS